MRQDADDQMRLIAEVLDISRRNDVTVWLRGGWAMDFYLGRVTRPHRDIDWFVEVSAAKRLEAALERFGYRPVPDTPGEPQFDLEKDGEDVSFAAVARDAGGCPVVPSGPYAGKPWPVGMLGTRTGRIGKLSAPVIEPAAQVEIKQMMPVWVPGMARRPKDLADIEMLEAAIRADLA